MARRSGKLEQLDSVLTCSIDGCFNKSRAKGYCTKHYSRFRRYEDASFKINRTLDGTPYMTKDGYVAINHKLQHRMIMESILGRPLYAHERVKHINGNKADNRVENLLLTSSLKPKSNSVEDKIAWAKEFLAVYDSI